MSRKRFSAEEIVNKLREADVLLSQEKTISQVCKQIGVTDQTYYRWRQKYGGMEVSDVRRLKELELENTRLKRLVAERDLAIEVMKEIQQKKW